jgi:hypothetical protein
MKFKDLAAGNAGTLVQAVDVLREDSYGGAGMVQPRKSTMRNVRRGLPGRMVEVGTPESHAGLRVVEEPVVGED